MLPRSTSILKRQLCKENLKPITDSIVPVHHSNKAKRMRTIE